MPSFAHLGTITAQLCVAGYPLTEDSLSPQGRTQRPGGLPIPVLSHSLLMVAQLVLNLGTSPLPGEREAGRLLCVYSAQGVSRLAAATRLSHLQV